MVNNTQREDRSHSIAAALPWFLLAAGCATGPDMTELSSFTGKRFYVLPLGPPPPLPPEVLVPSGSGAGPFGNPVAGEDPALTEWEDADMWGYALNHRGGVSGVLVT